MKQVYLNNNFELKGVKEVVVACACVWRGVAPLWSSSGVQAESSSTICGAVITLPLEQSQEAACRPRCPLYLSSPTPPPTNEHIQAKHTWKTNDKINCITVAITHCLSTLPSIYLPSDSSFFPLFFHIAFLCLICLFYFPFIFLYIHNQSTNHSIQESIISVFLSSFFLFVCFLWPSSINPFSIPSFHISLHSPSINPSFLYFCYHLLTSTQPSFCSTRPTLGVLRVRNLGFWCCVRWV